MKLFALAFFLVMMANGAWAQKLSLPDIFRVVDAAQPAVDTLLKHRGYELVEKEYDSTSILYYYRSVEKNESAPEAPTWVRSLTVVDASEGNRAGRIVSYRTYNSEEYRQLMAFLLAGNYRTTDQYKFQNATHTVFDNGANSIRVKITDNRLNNGKILKGYEFEVGK